MTNPGMAEKQYPNPKAAQPWTLRLTVATLKAWLIIALQVKKERYSLPKLSDDALKDIGISRYSALTESRRAFSDIPANRVIDH